MLVMQSAPREQFRRREELYCLARNTPRPTIPLFDAIRREFAGPADHAEPAFAFLNRSDRPRAYRIRELLEGWFAAYPETQARDLRARFRDTDDRQHHAAFFELYCYAALTRQGYRVEAHPATEGGRSPDFLALRNARPIFYLECTLAAPSNADHAVERRLSQFLDGINRETVADFFISVSVKSEGASPPSAARLRKFLRQQLAALDPEEVAVSEPQALPTWPWKENDWELEIQAIPIKAGARDKPHRFIGAVSYGYGELKPEGPIRKALESKASAYGHLDLPYAVAVNVLDELTVDADIRDALAGGSRLVVDRETRQYRQERSPDGFWGTEDKPSNQRASAVLAACRLTPWTFAESDPTLWHHPWARFPLDPSHWFGTQWIPDRAVGQMVRADGKKLWEILGLTSRWPE